MSNTSGIERANRMARRARVRLLEMARTARDVGAVPAHRPGEGLPEPLRGGPEKNPDPLDLPAGLHPVGQRSPEMPGLVLPGEKLPTEMQGRAAVKAVLEAAREAGLMGAASWTTCVFPVPDQAAVFEPPVQGSALPGSVMCYPTGRRRAESREAMIGAVMEAASTGSYSPTMRFGSWMDEARRERWDAIMSMGPQTEGLRFRLADAAIAAESDAGPAEHAGRWFQRVAGRLSEAAYDSGVPLGFACTETRPSGFQVVRHAVPSTQWATDPDARAQAAAFAFAVDAHAYEPAEFVEHVIDVVLYGNYADGGGCAQLARALRAAAVARFTPIPDAPPLA